MKKLSTTMRIKFWKGRMRAHYMRYCAARDRLDCGNAVAFQFPSVSIPARRVNACADRLRALGENAPKIPEPRP